LKRSSLRNQIQLRIDNKLLNKSYKIEVVMGDFIANFIYGGLLNSVANPLLVPIVFIMAVGFYWADDYMIAKVVTLRRDKDMILNELMRPFYRAVMGAVLLRLIILFSITTIETNPTEDHHADKFLNLMNFPSLGGLCLIIILIILENTGVLK
jgi:formate/nitrite transporter FocA (FNT family)